MEMVLTWQAAATAVARAEAGPTETNGVEGVVTSAACFCDADVRMSWEKEQAGHSCRA